MSVRDAETMRAAVAASIGRDSVYLSARDEVRHFDPFSLSAYYAGSLLFGFLKSGGMWLWETFKKKGAEEGERIVGKGLDAAADRLMKAASSRLGGADGKESLAKQAEQLDIATQALKELGTAAEPAYLESFLAAGEDAVKKQLMGDNFPEAKARRIAAAVTLQVEMRMKGAAA